MKYIVYRASDRSWGKDMPCDGCTREQVHEILWDGNISKGTVDEWTKEIPDLIEFIDKYGKIVVGKSDIAEIPYEVTIYDDYVE